MNNINTFKELADFVSVHNKKTFEVFQELEAETQETSVETVREMMRKNLEAMYNAINNGISSCQKSMSGLSGGDAQKIKARYVNNSNLPTGSLFGKILYYSIAVMEENIRMGRILACPTAGSCGIVPSVIIAYAETLNISRERQIDALITAGGIGKIIAQKVALAGAIAGCQAECGSAGAMAAAALTELMEGTTSQILNAAALSLKNSLGLACDPVAGLVEIPCVKRNGFWAIQAVTASEMALAGVESAIPVDEVVDAMKQIGLLMSPALKESSEGGLASTKTGQKISNRLKKAWKQR
jgi:L-serine dehydratase